MSFAGGGEDKAHFLYELRDLQDYRRVQPELETLITKIMGTMAERFLLGVNEAVGNALEHGSGMGAGVKVRMRCIKNCWLVIRIRDCGQGFAWRERLAAYREPAERNRRMMALEERGYGLGVMQAVVDVLIYNQRGNEVLLAKRLRPRSKRERQ